MTKLATSAGAVARPAQGIRRPGRAPAMWRCDASLHELAKALRRLGIIVEPGDEGTRSLRRHGVRGSSRLHIGAGELARFTARLASDLTRKKIFLRIFLEVDAKHNRRLVMARCVEFSRLFRGRRGFSARRLYNDYFKARRQRGRKGTR